MSERKLFPIDKELERTRPNAAKYAQIYGPWRLIPEPWNDVKLGDYKNTETVYKMCIAKGVTWEDLLDYKPDPDIVL